MPYTTKIWKALNSPFFLWVLTTITIGSISSLWSQRMECRAIYVQAENRFIDALSEYQYRKNKYFSAFEDASNQEEKKEAKIWQNGYVDFLHYKYKSKKMAEVTLDMLRAFGQLALVSDIDSFDIGTSSLSFTRRGGETNIFSEPSFSAINKLENDLETSTVEFTIKDELDETKNKKHEFIEKLRNDLYGDDQVLSVVRTTAMFNPAPMCSFSNILSRMFNDNNSVYESQVKRLLLSMRNEYKDKMIAIIAIEQLIGAVENSSSPEVTQDTVPISSTEE